MKQQNNDRKLMFNSVILQTTDTEFDLHTVL